MMVITVQKVPAGISLINTGTVPLLLIPVTGAYLVVL